MRSARPSSRVAVQQEPQPLRERDRPLAHRHLLETCSTRVRGRRHPARLPLYFSHSSPCMNSRAGTPQLACVALRVLSRLPLRQGSSPSVVRPTGSRGRRRAQQRAPGIRGRFLFSIDIRLGTVSWVLMPRAPLGAPSLNCRQRIEYGPSHPGDRMESLVVWRLLPDDDAARSR